MPKLPAQARAHVNRYLELRQKSKALHNAIVSTLDKKLLLDAARELGMLRRKQIVFECESETDIFMDHCIYDHLRAGRTPIDLYFDQNPPAAGSDEALLAEAMKSAQFSLLTIEAVEPGIGAHVRTPPPVSRFFLTDIALSKTMVPGEMLIARYIDVEGIVMSSGASIPLDEFSGLQVMMIMMQESMSASEIGKELSARAFGSKFNTAVLRACLQTGASEFVGYRDPSRATPKRHRSLKHAS
jgi:hypothetical protein